jgi:hypothetical protein
MQRLVRQWSVYIGCLQAKESHMATSRKDSWEALYRYWQSKHVDGHPPARSDLDPLTEIPGLIANLMIIDIEDGGYRYRLVGSEITSRFGGELTGKPVGSSAMSETVRLEWRALLDLVRDQQAPRMMVAKLPAEIEANHLMLILPLVDADGRTERILVGGFFFNRDYKPGFEADGLLVTEIMG